MRGNNGLVQGDGRGKGQMSLNPGNRLDTHWIIPERGITDDSKVFSLGNHKNWMNEVAFY